MYFPSVVSLIVVLWCRSRPGKADVCSYINTKDCAFLPDAVNVCGNNGITYRNSCFLAKDYCRDKHIHKQHDGPCTVATTAAPTTAATSDPLTVICGTMGHVHCAADIEPVCGSDDKTYVNSCEFRKEVCQQRDLTVKHIGFC